MPIVHRVPLPTHQPWQRVDELVRIPNLNAVGKQSGLDRFPNQSTVHRVHIAMDANQAARIDTAGHLQTRRQSRRRQGFES